MYVFFLFHYMYVPIKHLNQFRGIGCRSYNPYVRPNNSLNYERQNRANYYKLFSLLSSLSFCYVNQNASKYLHGQWSPI